MHLIQRGLVVAGRLVLLLSVAGTAAAQPTADLTPERTQILSVQVALDRAGFSPGEIDARMGPKTRQALAEFQTSARIASTGDANEETLAALGPAHEPLRTYTITPEDTAGPFIDRMPSDMMEGARLPALGYASLLEALAERFHASPALLRTLNPQAAWTAGETIDVPNVEPFELPVKPEQAAGAKPARGQRSGAKPDTAAKPALEVTVSGAAKSLVVRDASGRTLMYAPVTIGSSRDPLPVGEWKVVGVSWNPVFHYNPDLFWDANPAHAKAKIAPGPNNPVGVVWVDINKEHFGLHGTPEPSAIGRSESHGCIRLTNWDAARLARLVSPGTRVVIQ